MNIETLTKLRDEIIDGLRNEAVTRCDESTPAEIRSMASTLRLADGWVCEKFDAAIAAIAADRSTSAPLIYRRSEDSGIARATSVHVERGHRIKIETTSYSATCRYPKSMSAKTSHFTSGAWSEVLPWHGVDHADESETPARHAELVAKTIEFLEAP